MSINDVVNKDGSLNYQNIGGFKDRLDGHDSSLASNTSQLSDIALNISNYPQQSGETDDTARFQRAISALQAKGGGKLILGLQEYKLTSLSIPNNVYIEGQANGDPWATTNVTLLRFLGTTGTFITFTSYYRQKGGLSKVNIAPSSGSSRTNSMTAVVINCNNVWGGSAVLERVSITGFGVGVLHQVSYQSILDRCLIWECGTAVSYNSKITGIGQDPTTAFGNGNIVKNSSLWSCNIGVELAGDALNVFEKVDIEQNYIAIYTHALTGGYYAPQYHIFEDCWFETNGWKSTTDRQGNINPRYFVCNSDIDASFTALGTNVGSIPTFRNCYDALNVSPMIPSHNTNYQLWQIHDEPRTYRIGSDDTVKNVYNLPEYKMLKFNIGINNAWKEIFKVSNKGVVAKVGFNAYSLRGDYVTSGITTQTLHVNYSSVVTPENTVSNGFSSMALMRVSVIHNDGAVSSASYLIGDDQLYAVLTVDQIGVTRMSYGGLSTVITIANIAGTGSTDKAFDIQVNALIIKAIVVTINYFPNGLLLNG